MEHSENFIDNQKRLNLHKNQEGIYKCRCRIQGAYPQPAFTCSKLTIETLEQGV